VTSQQDYQSGYDPLAPPLSDVPAEFIKLAEALPPGIDFRLGYSGDSRFVLFYYDPWSEAVAWDDGRSHGFGLGGQRGFMETIAPLAARYDVHLGNSDTMALHVLLLDRLRHEAFFAERQQAEPFVAERRQFLVEG